MSLIQTVEVIFQSNPTLLQPISIRASKTFELTEQRGNVLATISDRKLQVSIDNYQTVAYYNPDVITAQDYSSFGVIQDGRQFGNAPRFTYNGKQLDRELNWQDYGMRESDPITGRFVSVDPLTKKYPMLTPYQYASNSPISGIDMDGLEYYYSASGALVWKYGTSTQVRVVSEDFVKKNYGKSVGLKDITANSRDVGITNAELNTRAFLTMLRRSENNGGKALPYNASNNLKKDGTPQTFTDKDYSEDPSAYKDHPGVNPNNKPHTQSGAYQILKQSWNTVIVPLDHPKDFGPEGQDVGVLRLITEQERYNPNKAGLMNDIQSGRLESAIGKSKGTWTSLPEGSQELLTMEEAKTIFKESVSNELQGKSVIGTPQGKLLSNQTTRSKQ